MAFSTAQRLMQLGVATPLAKELGRQMDAGSYNVFRLIEMGMVPGLAKIVVTQPFNKVKAVQLGMVPAVASFVAANGGVPTQTNALSPSKKKLTEDSSDLTWVFPGDSLGNAVSEFGYLFFEWLAPLYPKFTFVYYPPNGSGGYGTPVTVQTGSGSHTFRFYNPSVAGTLASYLMDPTRFASAFPVTPDLVMWDYGKNHVTGGTATQPQVQGEFLGPIAQVQLTFPSANHVTVDQYPNRTDAFMDVAHAAWVSISAADATILRVPFFEGATYVDSDYDAGGTDNQHLSPSANFSKLLPILQGIWANVIAADFAASAPWLSQTAANMLDTDTAQKVGDFGLDGTPGSQPGAVNGTTPPLGWTTQGTAVSVTYAKDTTIKYAANARSQNLIVTAGQQPRLNRSPTATKVTLMKGQMCMFTVLKFVEAGAAATMGRPAINFNGTGGPGVVSGRAGGPQGGWVVECIGPFLVPSDVSTNNVTLFADSSASPDLVRHVNWQWAALTIGALPRAPA